MQHHQRFAALLATFVIADLRRVCFQLLAVVLLLDA